MVVNMQIIAIVESDDCGPAAVLDASQISIMKMDDFYLAATRCVFTNQPISCEISEETAESLMKKGVKCFSLSSDRALLEQQEKE
jgi:uncharacterized protein (DUF39 family)